MEGTKYKIPVFFLQEKTYPTTNPHLLLKAFTMLITVSGNHNYWAMYHLKVACALLRTCRLEILNLGTRSLPSAPSVTLAPEFTQKLIPVHTCHTQQSGKQLLITAELVRIRTEMCQSQHTDYSGHIRQHGDPSSHKGLSDSGRHSEV